MIYLLYTLKFINVMENFRAFQENTIKNFENGNVKKNKKLTVPLNIKVSL